MISNTSFFAWLSVACLFFSIQYAAAQDGTRLLRQPDRSTNQLAFVYGGDIWTYDLENTQVQRITSTAAIESNPYFSPDGKTIAFSSNRSGGNSVYVVPHTGGMPTRLTWHPSSSSVRGWTPDGKNILYASTRGSAPVSFNTLWTVPVAGGPSKQITNQWGYDGDFSSDGKRMILDKMSRWDVEWRAYRGGQNTPLILLDLTSNKEILLPNEKTTDIQPLWLGDEVFFLSDRDWTMNVWAYQINNGNLRQVTHFEGTDVKWLGEGNGSLVIEQNGYLHLLAPASGDLQQLEINVIGDFPWAETTWEDVSDRVQNVSISPTGKRALMQSRGEIFTVPVEYGDARNLTQSSGAADRSPIWSPKGDEIAWFSDQDGNGYALYVAEQGGMSEARKIAIGVSKMAWSPTWSPDGKYIAFTDDDVRIQIVDLESGQITTAAIGTNNLDRRGADLTWSPDSEWLAYVVSGENNFHQIMVWNSSTGQSTALTDNFADAYSPAWDRDKKHFYFLASTDLALGSGWANTSAMQADPDYAAYVIVLQNDQESPFIPRSDEEEVEEEEEESEEEMEEEEDSEEEEAEEEEKMVVDFERIARRTIALPLPTANYFEIAAGAEGSFFLAEGIDGARGVKLHKFSLEDREADVFAEGVRQISISADGKKILLQINGSWKVANTGGGNAKNAKSFSVKLEMKLDRLAEWKQMFEEAWRYERDYFYDPNMHGRDWQVVHDRYAPLVPHIRHRSDLTYILDQVNGELSVGHSFVFGGDFPDTKGQEVGLLGADLVANNGRWQISEIYTTESWNPNLSSPLDRPGMKVTTGDYLVGINGKELNANLDPYALLDGTLGKQTVLHLNSEPSFEGAWQETVEPIRSENALRQRAWVENNRRKVDELSGGRLAYIWVPNTSGRGFVSFNRYYFAQQHKEGAVIDERFNGGGLLDDYMVDLMTRSLRAAITNEVPNGKAFRLPAGILGPKVLLINERAGSGGDFFPWVFRQQNAGPLIGATTWGGLVKSSVHYRLVDGGALTAPDNAVFDPVNNVYVGENEGIAPDIPVRQDAKALSEGRDPQLERGVREVLRMLEQQPAVEITKPPFNTPAKQ